THLLCARAGQAETDQITDHRVGNAVLDGILIAQPELLAAILAQLPCRGETHTEGFPHLLGMVGFPGNDLALLTFDGLTLVRGRGSECNLDQLVLHDGVPHDVFGGPIESVRQRRYLPLSSDAFEREDYAVLVACSHGPTPPTSNESPDSRA